MGLSVPEIVSVSVDGGRNSPGSNTEFDLEVALDIQVAGGCAPAGEIAVYFAPRTQAGWINAISKSATDFLEPTQRDLNQLGTGGGRLGALVAVSSSWTR